MKILNLYAGIGGNRKLWSDEHEVTAVERDPEIASVYAKYFPGDELVVGDAHSFLLENYGDYDFVWSSPPCPTHSNARMMRVFTGQSEPLYPDMTLYQEIIFLERFHKKGGGYCVENVKPYYKPLIPAYERDRHLFWANFYIPEMEKAEPKHALNTTEQQDLLGFNLDGFDLDKRKVLRNCVMPEVGKHILDAFQRQQQGELFA